MDKLFAHIKELQAEGLPFAIATVIKVKGSASARTGSKALINHAGKNIFGWVGGGCAESFVAKNAMEAMTEGQSRIVQADLDDEIFGLGMPCGGIMDVYIEPHLPPEKITLREGDVLKETALHLAHTLGLEAEFMTGPAQAGDTMERTLVCLAHAIAEKRGRSFRSLKEVKNIFPASEATPILQISELLIAGSSRITEELAKWGVMLKWPVRVFAQNLLPENYPAAVKLAVAEAGYTNFNAKAGSVVVVASHHKGDPEFIQQSLAAGAQYVGLIASGKRSGIIMEHLKELQLPTTEIARVYAPAGLEMDCKNPAEIALSVLAEIIRGRYRN